MTARFAHLSLQFTAAITALFLCVAPNAARAQSDPTQAPLPPPAASAPGSETVTPIGTKITAGDRLVIGVYGDSTLSETAIVQSDGTIQYPLVGRVALAGQTPVQAKETLQRALERYVKHPIVSLAIAQQGQISVLVLGNVKQSGRYQVRSGAHITEALAAAGGVAQFNGAFPTVRVLEVDGTLQTSNLNDLLRKGDATQNVALGDNATMYVTGAETLRIQVLGAVTRPGNVEVFEGDRLSMALARAGADATAKPDLNRVYLTRKDAATGATHTYQFNMFESLQKGDQRFDPILQKDDTVYIPEARQMSPAMLGMFGVLGRVLGF
jgi:polysaccharide biosynthesis/export protein